jgi:hypothetical protein
MKKSGGKGINFYDDDYDDGYYDYADEEHEEEEDWGAYGASGKVHAICRSLVLLNDLFYFGVPADLVKLPFLDYFNEAL